MRITSITEKSNGINILVGDGYDYFIPKTQYDRGIDGISDWTNQLLGKTWADKYSLYKVGAILSRYTKDSNIDWVRTFIKVERRFFIREIQDNEELNTDEPKAIDGVKGHSSKSIFENLMGTAEIGKETHTAKNKILMKERVKRNMERYRFKN